LVVSSSSTVDCSPPLDLRLLDVAAKLDRPVRQIEIAERAPEVLRRDAEHRLGLPVGQRHQAVGRNDHLRDGGSQ